MQPQNSNYNEESIEVFERFLRMLTRLSYHNIREAFNLSKEIAQNINYERLMDQESLRLMAFQAIYLPKIFKQSFEYKFCS